MRRFFIASFLCLNFFSSGLSAQEGPLPVEKVLPSGLRIIALENPGSQTVSVNVFISAGSLDETNETTGLAHFYEHMFFRGTPTLSGLAFKKAIEDSGGITNATTAKDTTHYFISLPSEQAERGLELLADALIRAELTQDGIDIERDVVLEEYRIGENNPGRIAIQGLYKLAYGDHPYSLSTIGTKAKIKSYQRSDFVKWRERHYGPSRCTVVVVGDVDANKIVQKTRFLFNSFKGSKLHERQLVALPPIPAEPVYAEGTAPIGSSLTLLGFPAPSAHDSEDVYGVDVLSFILGQGEHSVLHQELIKKQKLAQSVGASYLTPRQRGLIIVSAAGEARKTDEIRAAVLEQVERVKNGEFTDDDIRRAKARLLQSYLQGSETNSGKADTIGFYSSLGVPGFYKDYPKRIQEVDRDEIVKAAQKYLTSGHWGYTIKPGARRKRRR